MSRGLGALERAILQALSAPRELWRFGYFDSPHLAEGIGDLREVADRLWQHQGSAYRTRASFQASFSRAVRGLLRRDLLQPLAVVPLQWTFGTQERFKKYRQWHQWEREKRPEGAVLLWASPQVRFVRKC
jgi:hypothetical protein